MQTTLMAKHDAAEIVRRFEMSTMTLHSAHREWLTHEISTALSALQREVPDGWQLVPKEDHG